MDGSTAMGYKSTLPNATPMFTHEQKHGPVQWGLQHKDDDWSRTRFADETCYQLFRNTIGRWSRNPVNPSLIERKNRKISQKKYRKVRRPNCKNIENKISKEKNAENRNVEM